MDICKKMTPLNKQTAFKKKEGEKREKEGRGGIEALALELELQPGPVRDANDAP